MDFGGHGRDRQDKGEEHQARGAREGGVLVEHHRDLVLVLVRVRHEALVVATVPRNDWARKTGDTAENSQLFMNFR